MSEPVKKLPITLPPRFEWIRHLAERHPIWTILALLVVSLPATVSAVTLALLASRFWW